jgi:uncharacterized protein (DUF433 family)
MHAKFYAFQKFKIFSKSLYCIMNWQEHIVSDKKVLLGKPTIKGTRISVELILELLSAGWTEQQILDSYPTVSTQSLRAVFAYLRECMQQELYFPISA